MKHIPLGSVVLASILLFTVSNAKGQDTSACRQLGVDCSHPPKGPTPPRPGPTRQEIERGRAAQKEREERAKKIAEEKQWCQKALDRGDAVAAVTQCSKALALAPDDTELQACVERANIALADGRAATKTMLLREELENTISAEKSRAQAQHLQDENAARQIDNLISGFDVDTGQARTAVSYQSPLPPMPPKAAELVAAMNQISDWPVYRNQRTGDEEARLPKGRPVADKLVSINCQTFFRALGEELARRNIPSWSNTYPLSDLGKTSADRIVYNMAHDIHWKKLDNWQEAQAAADQGSIVIGGLRARTPEEHGHLAVVFPTPPGTDLTKFESEGNGPFVRDGNEHRPNNALPYSPSTWGAVRASRAMPLSRTTWYIWVP